MRGRPSAQATGEILRVIGRAHVPSGLPCQGVSSNLSTSWGRSRGRVQCWGCGLESDLLPHHCMTMGSFRELQYVLYLVL
jgi:hypothetical protein